MSLDMCIDQGICLEFIGLDKSGYQVNIFHISPGKHNSMLWVLIRSTSLRCF